MLPNRAEGMLVASRRWNLKWSLWIFRQWCAVCRLSNNYLLDFPEAPCNFKVGIDCNVLHTSLFGLDVLVCTLILIISWESAPLLQKPLLSKLLWSFLLLGASMLVCVSYQEKKHMQLSNPIFCLITTYFPFDTGKVFIFFSQENMWMYNVLGCLKAEAWFLSCWVHVTRFMLDWWFHCSNSKLFNRCTNLKDTQTSTVKILIIKDAQAYN